MTTRAKAAIGALVDRAQIRDVLLRYARGVDRRDLELVRSCFTPDAEYQGSLSSSDIGDALRALGASLERYASTMHFFANQTIEVAAGEARSETYAIAYHRQELDRGERDLVLGVCYRDELIRDRGRWLICRRQALCDWRRHDWVVPAGWEPRSRE